jgi:hypothetical protein
VVLGDMACSSCACRGCTWLASVKGADSAVQPHLLLLLLLLL